MEKSSTNNASAAAASGGGSGYPLEGFGVTNYSIDQPASFGYSIAGSSSTSEWDDALIRRGIRSREDTLVARGASRAHAQHLLIQLQLQQQQAVQPPQIVTGKSRSDPDADFDQSDQSDSDENDLVDDEYDDTEVLQEYRRKRLEELQQQQQQQLQQREEKGQVDADTTVQYITRADWTKRVNRASHQGWVVVCLISSTSGHDGTVVTAGIEAACHALAIRRQQIEHKEDDDLDHHHYQRIQWVMIEAAQAASVCNNSNNNNTRNTDHSLHDAQTQHSHPYEHRNLLPCLFCYRHGTMQHSFVRLPQHLTAMQLETMLTNVHVL